MAADGAWGSWLTQELQSRGVDTDVFVDYLTGVVSDETLAEDERREALAGILASAAEDGAESLADTLLSKWSELQGIAATEADAAVPGGDEAAGVSMKALMADEDAALQEAQRKREAAASAGGMSASQKRRLIAEYGTEENVTIDEQGNVIEAAPAEKGEAAAEDAASDLSSGNLNRARVDAIEKEKRMALKAASDAKKRKDKEDLLRQRQKKVEDKERKQTTKKERRR